MLFKRKVKKLVPLPPKEEKKNNKTKQNRQTSCQYSNENIVENTLKFILSDYIGECDIIGEQRGTGTYTNTNSKEPSIIFDFGSKLMM